MTALTDTEQRLIRDAVRQAWPRLPRSPTRPRQHNDVNGSTREGKDWLRGARHVAAAVAGMAATQ